MIPKKMLAKAEDVVEDPVAARFGDQEKTAKA
jgi:hypothetical protein